jgi:5-bromo-4-chloroindolyl phosphate hydrolysis protein
MTTRRGRRSLRARLAGLLLILLALPLLLKALFSLWSGDAGMLAATTAAFALVYASAMLTRRGVEADEARRGRPLARRGRLPLKALAGAALACATALTAYAAVGHSIVASLAFAIAATAGYYMVYAGDEAPSPLPSLPRSVEGEEVRLLLERAYERLDEMEAAAKQLPVREFRDRLGSITSSIGKILGAIEQDPADLRRARKFLNVYLDGAHKVTLQYARTAHASSPEREQNFRTLLVDMENTCHEQYQKLLQHDALDLDVQIEVLTARLRREGVG